MMMTMLRHHEYDDYDDYDDDDYGYIWEPELVHRQQDVHLTEYSSLFFHCHW